MKAQEHFFHFLVSILYAIFKNYSIVIMRVVGFMLIVLIVSMERSINDIPFET